MNSIRCLYLFAFAVCVSVFCPVSGASSRYADEDGSRLWLRGENACGADVSFGGKMTPAIETAITELRDGWHDVESVRLELRKGFGKEAFRIRSGKGGIVITASGDTGLLYGAYHLLRMQNTGADMSDIDVLEEPVFGLRILDHWDNPDGSIERGYAGHSLWRWDELPAVLSPRYREYARANASVGINGTVLNNVNASPSVLAKENLIKAKALADVFRPYGVKVYISVNFASPMVIGGLSTADPLDKGWPDGGKRKPTRYMLSYLISEDSLSRPIPKGSPVRVTMAALTPRARICLPVRLLLMAV